MKAVLPKIELLLAVLLLTTGAVAQTQSIMGVGLHGGGNQYLDQGQKNAQMGGGGFADIAYMFYKEYRTFDVGFKTGLSVGYTNNQFKHKIAQSFTRTDYLGNEIMYTVSTSPSAKVTTVHQIMAEVPLMVAFRVEQFYFNVGAKVMIPVWEQYKQDISAISIDAYFPKYSVHLTDKKITGRAEQSCILSTKQGCLPQLSVLAGVEVGYEWKLSRLDYLGLGLYFDFSPWNTFKASAANEFVSVGTIKAANSPAQVDIQPLYASSVSRLMYCDFGIKLYYGIDVTSGNGLHRHR